MECIDEAIEKHKIEFQAAKQSGIIDIKNRAMDNLAVSSGLSGPFPATMI